MSYPLGMSVIISDNNVTVDFGGGDVKTARRGQRNFSMVMDLLRNWNEGPEGPRAWLFDSEFTDELSDAFTSGLVVDTEGYLNKQDSEVTYEDGTVMYQGKPLQGFAVERIKALSAYKLPIDNMLRFLENLQENPSYKSVEQLYGFLEVHTMPISNDGCFYAYKVITSDFKDCYTSEIDNSVGSHVSMSRNKVEDNPDRTCSAGLHVCAFEYAKNFFFGNGRILVKVKINPKDVVSIPTDYNNAKMRVCAYTVDSVIETAVERDVLGGQVYEGYNMNYNEDPLDDSYDSSWIRYSDYEDDDDDIFDEADDDIYW